MIRAVAERPEHLGQEHRPRRPDALAAALEAGDGVAPDLLDLITEEEKWVAAEQKRTPRTRAELAGFIDTSILKEAQGGRP